MAREDTVRDDEEGGHEMSEWQLQKVQVKNL